MPYKGDKKDKNAARPPEGSLVETRCLIIGPKSAIVPFPGPRSGPKSRTGPGYWNAVYNQNTIEKWKKDSILPFSDKGDLGIAKKDRGITLPAIAIYNTLLSNYIDPEIENFFLERIKMVSEKPINNITDSKNPSNLRSLCKINSKRHLFVDFSSWPHTLKEDGANTSSEWSPQRNFLCHS